MAAVCRAPDDPLSRVCLLEVRVQPGQAGAKEVPGDVLRAQVQGAGECRGES